MTTNKRHRHPSGVKFTNDLRVDALRRDLTINALFYDIDKKEVVDFVGGIDDIKKGIVKAVGNPVERFDEDRLRILRVLRFAGRMGSKIDEETSNAIKSDNALTGVSPERIRDEFLKGIKSSKGSHFLLLVNEYDMWKNIFPGLSVSTGMPQTKNVPVLLAYLLNDNNSQLVAKKLNALKYSAEEVSQVTFLLNFKTLTPENAFRLKKMFSSSKLSEDDIFEYSELLSNQSDNLVGAFVSYTPSVKGDDLIAQGFKGAELGKELERLETEKFKELL